MARPFADSVELYRSQGWAGVLWFPPFTKHPPPTGYTGAKSNGRYPDDEQIATWLRRGPDGNVGLRLPKGVVGIDVDAYDDKRGAETLDQAEQAWGVLPKTWISTSRRDGISGIRWFRVPDEAILLDRIPPYNSGIEIIQHAHRYAVVWPSIHPDTGATYRWVDPQGREVERPPRPEDLPELPREWLLGLLRRDETGPDAPEEGAAGGGSGVSLGSASSFYDLLEIYAQRIRDGAPRNDTGRDLAIQLRDNGCSKRDAVVVWGPLWFQLLGPLANAPGADGEPYEPREWSATVASIWTRPRREPLPGFATPGPSPASGGHPDAAGSPGGDPGPSVLDDRLALTTDLGNSIRFARLLRDHVRYVHGEDRWLIWDGVCWAPDQVGRIIDLTKLVIDQLRREAEEAGDDTDARDRLLAHAVRSEGLQTRRNMVAGAATEPGIGILPSQVDSDPLLLCALNGTIHLRTGELREHRQSDLISRICSTTYDPRVRTSDLLNQFCATFMPDPQELEYLFRSLGYCLLGDNPHRLWYIMLGATTSGKSQLMEAIAEILGDYAVPVGTSVFRANQDDKPRPDLIRALTARLVYAEEASHGWELHTDQVKRLTGGGRVSARGMHANTMIEWKPNFTPLIVTNEMPRIRGADQAVKRRMVVLKFGHSLDPELEDPTIKQRFINDETTRQALLYQLVQGCVRAQERGWRDVPEGFQHATVEAFSDLNHVGTFLDYMRETQRLFEGDDTVPLANCWKAVDLHAAYGQWINEHGDAEDRRTKLGMRDFGKALRAHGWESRPSSGTRWLGKYNPATAPWAPSNSMYPG